MTEAQAKDKFWQWIDSVTTLTVIFKNQNGVRPALPYITLLNTETRTLGQREITGTDASGNTTYQQRKELMMEIEGYGEETQAELQNIFNKMLTDEAIGSLSNLDLVTRVEEDVRDISFAIDLQTIENRCIGMISVGFKDTFIVDTSYIGNVEYTGNISGKEISDTI